jgi:hypothetical protein
MRNGMLVGKLVPWHADTQEVTVVGLEKLVLWQLLWHLASSFGENLLF